MKTTARSHSTLLIRSGWCGLPAIRPESMRNFRFADNTPGIVASVTMSGRSVVPFCADGSVFDPPSDVELMLQAELDTR